MTPAQKARFRAAIRKFVTDLGVGHFRKGLKVKGIEGAQGIFEMTWAPNGRATFQYRASRGTGAHIIWRRIGPHDVLGEQ